jgi:hypothetical protein
VNSILRNVQSSALNNLCFSVIAVIHNELPLLLIHAFRSNKWLLYYRPQNVKMSSNVLSACTKVSFLKPVNKNAIKHEIKIFSHLQLPPSKQIIILQFTVTVTATVRQNVHWMYLLIWRNRKNCYLNVCTV